LSSKLFEKEIKIRLWFSSERAGFASTATNASPKKSPLQTALDSSSIAASRINEQITLICNNSPKGPKFFKIVD